MYWIPNLLVVIADGDLGVQITNASQPKCHHRTMAWNVVKEKWLLFDSSKNWPRGIRKDIETTWGDRWEGIPNTNLDKLFSRFGGRFIVSLKCNFVESVPELAHEFWFKWLLCEQCPHPWLCWRTLFDTPNLLFLDLWVGTRV